MAETDNANPSETKTLETAETQEIERHEASDDERFASLALRFDAVESVLTAVGDRLAIIENAAVPGEETVVEEISEPVENTGTVAVETVETTVENTGTETVETTTHKRRYRRL